MTEKLTGLSWLNEHIKELEVTTNQFKSITQEITKICPDVCNEFQAWTPLKLVLLNYVIDVCSLIISNNIKNKKVFEKCYYVDLFAGSGLNKIKKDFIIGSPLICSLKYSERFNSLFFCEYKDELFDALNKRLNYIKKPNIFLKKEDCNKYLNTIITQISSKKAYCFFFIDPHCMEFSWESMIKVLGLRSDIVFTFMTSEIFRSIGLCKSGKSNGEYLNNFFGDNSWKSARDYEDLVRLYEINIQKIRPDAILEHIAVKSTKFNFCYHSIFVTNKTKNGCPWMKAIEKAKREIEANSDKSVEKALEIVTNRQRTLF